MKLNKKHLIEILLVVLLALSPLIPTSMRLIILLLLITYNLKYLKVMQRTVFIAFFLIESLLLIAVVNDLKNGVSGFSLLNFYIPLNFLLAFLLAHKYSLKQFSFYIEKIAFYAAVFSLIGMIFYLFLPNLVYSLPTYHYYHTSPKTAFIFNVLLDESGIVQRNAGIASEPGLFQLLLNLGFYFHIQMEHKLDLKKVAIYSIALLGTRSTIGLIIYTLLVFVMIEKYKYMLLIIFPLLVFYGTNIISEIIYQSEHKLLGSRSFEARLEPMLNVFQVGFKHPLGLGNTGYDLVYSRLKLGAWDSYGQILIRYGYLLLFVFLVLLFNLLLKDISIFVIIALTLTSQGVWFTPFIVTFLFLGLKKDKDSREGVRNKNSLDHQCTIARNQPLVE